MNAGAPQIQQLIIRLLTLFEVLFYLVSLPPFQSAITSSSSSVFIPQLVVTPLFLMGVLLVVSGAVARLSAFRSLGPLFTFDLTIHPAHRLITTGLYSWVRHPAYTGSLAIVAGLGCSHLSGGSLLASLPSLAGWGSWVELSLGVFGAIWWLWTLGIGLSRVEAEDKQMQLLFTGEWDVYAERVRCWFIPGLV
jgi:protein-S-isoprenylcysteine O-methyltransferase Ste14